MKSKRLYSPAKLIASIFFILIVILFTGKVLADSVDTSVTVGNEAPTVGVGIAENPASDSTTPTNVGDDVTFQITATDSSNEDYYLAICKTNSVTANNGGAPSCGGGAWCISSATTSGTQASCSYTAQQADSSTGNAWYAFVCDGNSGSASCSTSSQGSGSSGSPFDVNHAPTIDSISYSFSNTIRVTNVDEEIRVSITDSDGDASSSYFVVCKTSGLTGNECDGGASDTLCNGVSGGSYLFCGLSGGIPYPMPAGTYDAYVYVFDAHDFASTSATQGSNNQYIIQNEFPSITAITLNGGSDIALTEGTTTAVPITATVGDANSCTDIASVTASVYRSGIGFSSCDTGGESDANNCYALVTCSIVGGSCTGTSDENANYTCSVDIQYHADPTDAGTEYPTENWLTTIVATDAASATRNTQISSGVELLSLIGFDITSSIAYGSLGPGDNNATLDKTTTVTATGNVGLDIEVSGTDMTDGGSGTIEVENQEYALASSTNYGSGTDLSGSATEIELNVPKTTTSGSAATSDVYWGLLVPLGTIPGNYTGTNTVTALKGETANW